MAPEMGINTDHDQTLIQKFDKQSVNALQQAHVDIFL